MSRATSTQAITQAMLATVRDLPGDTIVCLGFFSRLRVRSGHERRLSEAIGAWPLAGVILAFPSSLLLVLLLEAGASPLLSTLLAIAAFVALQGGLHEDGLADVADGFGGGGDAQGKLAIMRDSRLGTYGAMALVFSIGFRATGLAAMAAHGAMAALGGFLMVAVLSRAGAAWHWHHLRPARGDGLSVLSGRPDAPSTATAAVAALTVGFVTALVTGSSVFLLALVAVTSAALLFTALADAQVGGQTGDTIGACQQACETAAFVSLGIAAGAP